MHVDSLTVTALVAFIIMLAVFVRFCQVKVCGNITAYRQDKQDRQDNSRAGGKS